MEGPTLAAAERKLSEAKRLIVEAHTIAQNKGEKARRKINEGKIA
jgi:hypothetical protein